MKIIVAVMFYCPSRWATEQVQPPPALRFCPISECIQADLPLAGRLLSARRRVVREYI